MTTHTRTRTRKYAALAMAGMVALGSLSACAKDDEAEQTASSTYGDGATGDLDANANDQADAAGADANADIDPDALIVDTDGDGMPDSWETSKGLNPLTANHNAATLSTLGYTDLEVYLHELSARLVDPA